MATNEGGNGGGDDASGGRKAEPGRAEEEGQELGQEDYVEGELTAAEMLAGLARLDLEAAQAYRAAADSIEDAEIADALEGFERDHRRHVADIRECLDGLGAGELARTLEEGGRLLSVLAQMAAPMGPHAVIITLLNNEQLTNLSYDDALLYDWDEQVEEVLERNRGDEQRHLEWLTERHDQLAEEEDEEQPSAP